VAVFRFCLEAGGLDVTDVDCVAFYESPEKKLARQLWAGRRRRGRGSGGQQGIPTDLHPVFGEVYALRAEAKRRSGFEP
jgi:hypothetical protein